MTVPSPASPSSSGTPHEPAATPTMAATSAASVSSRAPSAVHERSVVVDGLQISNWNRDVVLELVKGGVTGVNVTCAVWEGPTETLRTLGDWCELARHHDDVVTIATTADDIRQAKRDGKVAILWGFQNTSPFGDDYRLVEVFSRIGVKIAQLTYNIQNLVGGSCYEPADSGLTRFGRTIVSEMNRTGMLVDLSHVGDRTSRDAIDASAQPVAITHANPTWFVENPRNKPDDVITALTARGGVIGCCLYPLVVGGSTTTLEQFCQMVARLVDQVGAAHVALGSDCTRNWDEGYVSWLRNGRWQPPAEAARWPTWPSWFTGPADFPRVTEGLLATGLPEPDVEAILGGNWLRLFDEVFPGVRA